MVEHSVSPPCKRRREADHSHTEVIAHQKVRLVSSWAHLVIGTSMALSWWLEFYCFLGKRAHSNFNVFFWCHFTLVWSVISFSALFVKNKWMYTSKNALKLAIDLEMSTHPDAWKSWWKTLAGALQVNDIRSEYHNRSTNDIDSLLIHSECSFLLTSFTRSAFVARFSTYIVFFLFNMSQAKTKYLVHPLLGKPENCLPREMYPYLVEGGVGSVWIVPRLAATLDHTWRSPPA